MPIKSCTLPNGKSGFKYGDSGKCYPTRRQALQQMKAIKANSEAIPHILHRVSDVVKGEKNETD